MVRGDPFITFAQKEEWDERSGRFCEHSTDRLREMRTKGGGVPKSQKFCECKNWMPPNALMGCSESFIAAPCKELKNSCLTSSITLTEVEEALFF